jgi:uncharacterized protein (DUF433 family)
MNRQACIRGLHISVATVIAMIADGMSTEEIPAGLPDLTREDIGEALHCAAAVFQDHMRRSCSIHNRGLDRPVPLR